MTSRFTFELTRQVLRWLAVYLVGIGLPAEMAETFGDPDFVSAVAGMVTLAIAEAGWLAAKYRDWRAKA